MSQRHRVPQRTIYEPLPLDEPPSQEVCDGADAVRCQNLFRAVLLQAFFDADAQNLCGAGEAYFRNARHDALAWLLAESGTLKRDRYIVSDLAGVNPLALDRAIAERRAHYEQNRETLIANAPKGRVGLRKGFKLRPKKPKAAPAPAPQPAPAPYTPTLDDIRAELIRRGIKLEAA